ncbi:MAG: hypothetical protein ISS49_16815 [Anaerolineae bacterium]|nr:hypothetical protein [Anaerolineae bacterium]
MSEAALVRDIETLRDMEGSQGRFAGEIREALNAAELEIRRTLDWLQERLHHWQREVERWRQEVQRARAALERCLRSGYRDRNGHYHPPDCSAYQTALFAAERRLQAAEAELSNTRKWLACVREAEAPYRVEARRLERMAFADIPRARALLNRKIADLEAYLAVSVAEAAMVAGVTLAAAGGAAVGAAIALLRSQEGDLRRALGAQGEQIAAQLVAEEFALKELLFDQPKHGFDRVFGAPGIPVIVVESKVASNGKLHLGRTRAGEQASPEWVAATVEKMTDVTSAQWSPANERIAALVRDLGPENVPVLTVVINPTTETADVYYRQGTSENWLPLQQGLSLRNLGLESKG